MKVLFYSNVRTMSGGEGVLLDLLRSRPELEATVAAPRGHFLDACDREGVATLRLRAPTELQRRKHIVWPLAFALRWVGALIETTVLLARRHPDVLHANNFAAGIYAILPARLVRVPMVWQIHDVFTVGSIEARVLKRLARAARCLVAVSDTVRRSLIEFGVPPNRIVTIPNAVDARTRFNPATRHGGTIRAELLIPEETVIISFVGQVSEHKGSGLILEAMEQLVEKVDRDIHLVVAGASPPQSGNYEETLRKRVSSSAKLQERVAWLGQRRDVPDLMADSQVVVNGSLVPEAFGMTVLEGMAMARIVVAPNAAGTAEIVENGQDGFLFNPGDAEDLAQVLAYIIDGLDGLDGVRELAREKALNHYDIAGKREAVTSLYKRIVSGSV